jgi:DNA-binding winged helix-turn-helix (wHTH) protein
LEIHALSLGFSQEGCVRVRFGDVTFDPDTRRLLRGGKDIHLSPKAFELLKTLIDHRPRALSKNELHQHLWPATFVSDANLASLIAEIREALADSARQPRFIRTVHRFGYAFCGQTLDEPAAHVGTDSRVGHGPDPEGGPVAFCWLVKDGKRMPLISGENILGRESDGGGIRIDSPTVSRRHARIVVSASSASIEDLESKNGTYLQGEPVTAAVAIENGDEIRIGAVVLRFRMASGSRTATWTRSG